MRIPVAVASCCITGLCLANAGHAQQSDHEFQLAFCNMSQYSRVLVALAHRQDAQRWVVAGWYPIPDSGCSVVGNFLGDTVFYYAFGETRDRRYVTWSAADDDKNGSSQCIDFNKFFRVTAGMPKCASDQEPVRFRMIRVGEDEYRRRIH
jgi:uncharacterized membrane protein